MGMHVCLIATGRCGFFFFILGVSAYLTTVYNYVYNVDTYGRHNNILYNFIKTSYNKPINDLKFCIL